MCRHFVPSNRTVNLIPESPERFAFERILEIATQKHEDHDGHDLCALCLIQGWAISALEGKLAGSGVESPPECEALLAEALETLAKFPLGSGLGPEQKSWFVERGYPTYVMIGAFLTPDSVTPST
jgi:hypothetical protein